MPWVRIDEKAMDHPKFVAISANAWRLWCEGQSYCQKHLTDGIIPRQVLKGFRYYSPASYKMLITELVPGKGPLWHQTTDGVNVHDYLDWNDSRDTVLHAREEAKERKRRWRDGHVGVSGNAFQDAGRTRSETRSSLRDVLCSSSPGVESQRGGGHPKATYVGSRLKVWTWQHDDLARRLGTKPFDLLGWYPRLNAELEQSGASYADPWQWLQQRFYAEAKIPLPNLFGKKPQPAQVTPKVTNAADIRAKWQREMETEGES